MTSKPYHYGRFRKHPLDLGEALIGLRSQGFTVEKHNTPPKTGLEISLKQVFNKDVNRDH
jgi:hypothetical protein